MPKKERNDDGGGGLGVGDHAMLVTSVNGVMSIHIKYIPYKTNGDMDGWVCEVSNMWINIRIIE